MNFPFQDSNLYYFCKERVKESNWERKTWLNARGISSSKNNAYDSTENYKLEMIGGQVISFLVTVYWIYSNWIILFYVEKA